MRHLKYIFIGLFLFSANLLAQNEIIRKLQFVDSLNTRLRISRNLADLANTTTARANLGVYSIASVNSLVGAKLDTTLAPSTLRSQWSTAYTDRLKWDGGATGLVAATGRTSLGLGSMALVDSLLFKSEMASIYAPRNNPTLTGRTKVDSFYIGVNSDPMGYGIGSTVISSSVPSNGTGQFDSFSAFQLLNRPGMPDNDNIQTNEIDWLATTNTLSATKKKIAAIETFLKGSVVGDRGGEWRLDTKQDGGTLASALVVDNLQRIKLGREGKPSSPSLVQANAYTTGFYWVYSAPSLGISINALPRVSFRQNGNNFVEGIVVGDTLATPHSALELWGSSGITLNSNSATLRNWKISPNVTLNNTLQFIPSTADNGFTFSTSVFDIGSNGTIKTGGAILPFTTSTYNLGSSSLKWADGYFADSLLTNVLIVSGNIMPTVNQGSNLGATGTRFNFIYGDTTISNHVSTSTLAINSYMTTSLGIGISPTADLQVQLGTGSASFMLGGTPTANGGGRIYFVNSNSTTNWLIATNNTYGGALEFTPSTLGGGSTFTTPAFWLSTTGAATFASSITSGAITSSGSINTTNLLALKETYFGYGGTYKALQIGESTANKAISIGYDPSGNTSGGFYGNEIIIPNNRSILAPNAANNAFLGILKIGSDNKLYIGGADNALTGHLIIDETTGIATFASSVSATNVWVGYTSDPTSGNKFAVNGNGYFNGTLTSTGKINFGAPGNLKSYTVATLPVGTQGDFAYVTDALAPTFLGALTGGGTVVTPVFYNGAAWVSF